LHVFLYHLYTSVKYSFSILLYRIYDFPYILVMRHEHVLRLICVYLCLYLPPYKSPYSHNDFAPLVNFVSKAKCPVHLQYLLIFLDLPNGLLQNKFENKLQ
jgi:hypothetical protein